MKQIPLSGKRGRGMFAIVDDEDFSFLSRFSWSLSSKGYVQAYVPVKMKDKYPVTGVQMQRLLLWEKTGKGRQIDHINHNKLDNRKENLRDCTLGQNNQNRHKIKFSRCQDKISRYKGVWWDRSKWRCAITVQGRKIYLGRFSNEIEAALAYNNAAIMYHGEFAKLNAVPKLGAIA